MISTEKVKSRGPGDGPVSDRGRVGTGQSGSGIWLRVQHGSRQGPEVPQVSRQPCLGHRKLRGAPGTAQAPEAALRNEPGAGSEVRTEIAHLLEPGAPSARNALFLCLYLLNASSCSADRPPPPRSPPPRDGLQLAPDPWSMGPGQERGTGPSATPTSSSSHKPPLGRASLPNPDPCLTLCTGWWVWLGALSPGCYPSFSIRSPNSLTSLRLFPHLSHRL